MTHPFWLNDKVLVIESTLYDYGRTGTIFQHSHHYKDDDPTFFVRFVNSGNRVQTVRIVQDNLDLISRRAPK